jgi:signal transduction histidine kinase/ligand-binding sensor domain-containing protein/DNA-binding response OmpR family regulator
MKRCKKSDKSTRKTAYEILTILLIILLVGQFSFSQPAGENKIECNTSNDSDMTESVSLNKLIFQSLPPIFDYNGVRCILKDHKGYMWFGTADGLIRYDGINLYVYENDPDDSTSLSYNAVNAIVEDKNKNLWVGTSIGLNLYNRDMDNFIPIDNTNTNINRLRNNYVSALCLDKKSQLWVGTFGDGVNVYDPEKQYLKHYSYSDIDPNSLSLDRITCITIDSNDCVWLGTQNGLTMYSEEIHEFKHFFMKQGDPSSLSNNNITSLAIDYEGNLWIGSRGGGVNKLLRRKNSYIFQHYIHNSLTNSISSNYILSLIADNRGYLWIGTENGGLDWLNINTGSIRVFQVEEGTNYCLNSNSIWALYIDNDDILWIGTFNKGINAVDEKFSKFESYQKNIVDQYGLTDNDVTGFTEDNRGNVWLATDGGGICRFDPVSRQFNKIIINSEGQNYLANNAIEAILYDSKENLWVGTWAGGIDRIYKNMVKIENYKVESNEGGGNNNIQYLYEDSKGNIWAGTAGSGLFKYHTASNTFVQINCNNPSGALTTSAYVTAMLEDSDGSLWIGTLYGMVILNDGPGGKYTCITFSRGNNSTGLSSNMIQVIFEDKNKRLWFGTGDNGLNLFNRKDSSFTAFQKKDGLPSNSILGILEDDEGYLWISTNKGLSKFNYDSLSFTNYTREDGLNSNEFYVRSCLRTKKGEFYFGGENGFNVFYPNNITNNSVIPPVYLTNLKINNIPAEIGAKNSPLKKQIGETTEIVLNHKQSSFTIEFVALNYTRSARNQFSYKLEGFNNDWNYVGNNRSASYTNIKPGRYIFLVKGSNNDGIWNNIPASLLIIIKPPYWKTWWAIISYIVIISIVIIVFLKIWNERIKIKHQLKLEQMGREKEHELNEANIQFFTNISHEFRTPLSLIIAPLESILSSAESKDKEQLMVIHRNAERLQQLTNNLMDIRKLEDGIMKLKVQLGDIIGFVKDISSYFNLNSKQHKIDFSLEANHTSIQGWFDPEKLETILLNLLSNAFKYTSDSGKIRITVNALNAKDVREKYNNYIRDIQLNGQFIEIIIMDNGIGISQDELPYIFDKFYRAKSSDIKKKSGTGIGLALTKGLIEMHHGSIWAESIPGEETRFKLILPINRNSYSVDEFGTEIKSVIHRNIIDDEKEITIESDKKEPAGSDSNEEKPEILIVEDNDELRVFLVNELGKTFTVSQAEDGKLGYELAMRKIPELIISDILMPRCTGIELCRLIKTDLKTCHIPVILLTAKTTINEQIEGIETGADVYITKPFSIQFLLAQINQLIKSRRELYAHFSQDVYIMPNKFTDNEMDQKFIQKAIDYIILNIADNTLDVEELSQALNLSRSNVYRKIKALTGKTIVEFIRIIRLKQAIKLMEAKKYSLAEVAYLTGFTSPSYFTKSFKEQYGKPPSDFLT